MATLQQVAERAGVALSTVSFVLNKNPRVSPETRETVLKAVEDLNYTLGRKGRPRRGAGEAPTPRRKNLVAFLIPFSTSALRMSAVYLSSVESAEIALAKANKGMIIRSVAEDQLAGEMWMPAKVDGSLMIVPEPAREFPRLSLNVPTVRLMGLPSPEAQWDHVTYDNSMVGVLAGRYLLQRGHRHCAFFSTHAGQSLDSGIPLINVQREQKFIETIRAGGGTVRVNPNLDDFQRILRELLLVKPRVTGLFIPGDDYTLTIYGMLFSMGIRPGVDVDVVSCNNDLTLMRGLHPRPATIDIHSSWIGTAGVGQLLQRLETPELPRSMRLFEPSLVPAEHPWPSL